MPTPGVQSFLEAASGPELWVTRKPLRIAVFGGRMTPADTTEGPASMRDAFMRWTRDYAPDLARALLCPESYKDWNHFNNYDDLLSFEADLGHITSAVIIFLEAPGAIAELAAFCQTESLRDQLIVVVKEEFHPKESFISLGPLRKLEGGKKAEVCVIPTAPDDELPKHLTDILRAIREKSPTKEIKEQYRAHDQRHQNILILDLITILRSATFADILEILQHFRTEVQETRLRQLLYTLESANLIGRRRKGGVFYFEPKNWDKSWIQYSGTPGRPFNRIRLQAQIARRLTEEKQSSASSSIEVAREIGRLAA